MKSVSQPPNWEVKLAVGEGPRAAEAAHGIAHGALDAGCNFSGDDGAVAVVDIPALVQGQQLQAWVEAGKLIGGEDTGLPAAQDGNVVNGIAHKVLLSYWSYWQTVI